MGAERPAHHRPVRVGWVHGFADRSSVWDPVMSALPPTHASIAPDFPWGLVARRKADARDAAGRLPDRLGSPLPDVIVGHSRGAYEAVKELAGSRPAEVRALILVAWVNSSLDALRERFPEDESRLFAALQRLMADRRRSECAQPDDRSTDRLAKYVHQRFRTADREVRVDPRLLRLIDCPTLVVVGADDWTVDLSEVHDLVGALPDATLRVLEGCGHWPMLTHPRRMADVILRFLADHQFHLAEAAGYGQMIT